MYWADPEPTVPAKFWAKTPALAGKLKEFSRTLEGATLGAQGLLNGTAKLAYEVGESKAAGGESPYSGNSVRAIHGRKSYLVNLGDLAFSAGARVANSAASRCRRCASAPSNEWASTPTTDIILTRTRNTLRLVSPGARYF